MHNVLMRLSFELRENGFTVHDSISGKVAIFTDGSFTAFTLDKEAVLDRVSSLQTMLMSANHHKRWKQPSDYFASMESEFVCREDGDNSWSIGGKESTALIKGNTFTYHRKFDIDMFLKRINKMCYELVNATRILQPRVDIVRRVPDARLVVWTYGEHSTVCYEDGINGWTMSNCLIDGKYYDVVLVQSDSDSGTCSLFTTDLELIVKYPLDDSIEFFYKDDIKECL